ncbi:MAG: vancomycin resistance histidine kinase VanS, partial [Lachnospiraceae bacterium]
MKNNYRKLKLSILLQTVFISALTVLVGGFILEYVVDGVYNDAFADCFVNIMKSLHMQEQTAIDLYWNLIGHNKTFFMLLGFLGLFAIFFYVSISKMTTFLHQVEDG